MGIPVTAYAAANGLGQDTATVLDSLFEGRRGLVPAPPELCMKSWVGEVPGELPNLPEGHQGCESRLARLTWALGDLVRDPVERATHRWGSARVGLVLGTSTAGILESERAVRTLAAGEDPSEFYDFQRQHALHSSLDMMAKQLGIDGPRMMVSTACSSSAKVFASARRLLMGGWVDAVLVGGVDTLCQMTVRGFASLEVLNPALCQPFSGARAGINIGEGGALVLLERERALEGSSDLELLGVGESSDAHHMTAPHPEGRGARQAMEAALKQAGLTPADVGQVNAHGTGTLQNDAAEGRAIADLLGSAVPVVSTKGYTGHTLGAAGATEAVFALASLERGQIPASLGCDPLDPAIHLDVRPEARDWSGDVVVSNSLAFGGSNCSVVFGRASGA